MSESIELELYNPSWVDKFKQESEQLEKVLDGWIVGEIQHIGSTSIPGMSAKPIIDIMIGVGNLDKAKACLPLLGSIDYCYAPYKADIMHWFCKPSPEHREYHLYLMEPDSYEYKARLAFRDYLIAHPDAAQTYITLKEGLAKEYHNDREAYTKAKETFVKDITSKALTETELR